jgi:hypothetical protein
MALADESGLSRNCAEAAGLPPTSTLYSLRYEKSSLKKLQTTTTIPLTLKSISYNFVIPVSFHYYREQGKHVQDLHDVKAMF